MDESLVTRTKPNSLEAEQSIIGCMLSDEKVVDEALGMLEKEDFYYQQYGIVFEAIKSLKNESSPVDIVTVTDKLSGMAVPAEIKDGTHFKYLMDSVDIVSVGFVKKYAQIIKTKSMLRQIIDKNREMEELCFTEADTVENILDKTEQNYLALLRKKGITEATPIDVIVNNAMEQIYRAYENKGEFLGIPTGFVDIDNMLVGLQDSDFILVAARPSMGKTAFALNIAEHVVLKQGLPVAIFSLEMPQESLVHRLFSIHSHINAKKLRKGDIESYEWTKLDATAEAISRSKLIIDESPALSLTDLRSKCRKYKEQNDIRLVIIDYLQLITTDSRGESRQQEISNISRSLKAIARELSIPVIAVSQLNRGAETREDKRPQLSDLRDSGAIEQDADVVMLIYRDEYYNKDESKDKGISEIIIAKHRNGPTGTVRLGWQGEYTRFVNLENPRNRMDAMD